MKFLIFLLMFLPITVFSHTSDQRYADGYIIDLSTAPVAPWVGEKTGMSFTFRDPYTGIATSSVKSASLSIDVLMRPNKKRSETIFQSKQFDIDRGGFVTDYVFTEEGTYDMHLTFIDTLGISHVAGFRKQVRDGGTKEGSPISLFIFFGVVLSTFILGFGAGKLSKK